MYSYSEVAGNIYNTVSDGLGTTDKQGAIKLNALEYSDFMTYADPHGEGIIAQSAVIDIETVLDSGTLRLRQKFSSPLGLQQTNRLILITPYGTTSNFENVAATVQTSLSFPHVGDRRKEGYRFTSHGILEYDYHAPFSQR